MTAAPPTPELPPAKAWPWYSLGILAVLLGVGLYAVQLLLLKALATPWHTAVIGTLGIFLMLMAVLKKPSGLKLGGFLLLAFVVGGEWYFLLHMSRVPAYSGPAIAGAKLPPFAAAAADGSPFTPASLEKGQATALIFYRGRW